MGVGCSLQRIMKNWNVIKWTMMVVAGCLLPAGCAVEARGPGGAVVVAPAPEVYVDAEPPALLIETPPPVPGPGFIWVGGSWAWVGGRWQWERGRWDRPPHPGMHWVAHRYEMRGGRRVFIRGGWR